MASCTEADEERRNCDCVQTTPQPFQSLSDTIRLAQDEAYSFSMRTMNGSVKPKERQSSNKAEAGNCI